MMSEGARKALAVMAGVAAGLLYLFAAMMFVAGYKIEHSFNEAKRTAPESSFAVDLSKAGVYEGRLTNGYMTGHGRPVYLEAEPGPVEPNWLTRLAAKCTLTAAAGGESESYDIGGGGYYYHRPEGVNRVEIKRVHPWDIGDYTMSIVVTTPVPELAGKSQRVVVGYQWCGLEVLGARFAQAIGVVSVIIAVMLTWWVWRRARRVESRESSVESPR